MNIKLSAAGQSLIDDCKSLARANDEDFGEQEQQLIRALDRYWTLRMNELAENIAERLAAGGVKS